jgi:hypothetical protein
VCKSITTTDVEEVGSDILDLKHGPITHMRGPKKAPEYEAEKLSQKIRPWTKK